MENKEENKLINNVDYIKLSRMKSLDIVNVNNGCLLGKIVDIEFNRTNGTVSTITILTQSRFKSLFRGEQTLIIPWDKIVKIGDDVIIVNYNL